MKIIIYNFNYFLNNRIYENFKSLWIINYDTYYIWPTTKTQIFSHYGLLIMIHIIFGLQPKPKYLVIMDY